MNNDLDALLRPKSVAVLGASTHSEKMGHIVLKNLSKGRFALHPVNPNEKEVLGLRCYPSISEVPGEVDLAILVLPATASENSVRECVLKGVHVVIVTSSGFGETGPEGNALECRLMEAIRGTETRILGPNTMGVFVPSIGLDSLLIPVERSRRPKKGNIAMLSQSGAVSVSFLEKAEATGIGISACVGLGNKSDIKENELLDYLSKDGNTRCIALYLESFSDGRGFLDVASKVVKSKPIVVLKSGRTGTGEKAAKSHTGALSSSDPVVDGVLRQAGVVRVYDEEELLDVAKALAFVDHVKGNRICVVASAGGFGVIAADYVESKDHGVGLTMARLSSKTMDELRSVAPGFSSVRNPVDLTSGVTDEMYDSALGVLMDDPGVDCIMMSLEMQPPHITRKLIDVAERRGGSGKTPLVVSAFASTRANTVLRALTKRKIPAYPSIWRALRAIRALSDRGHYLRQME
jgi:acyl-CoA synthetase (NDP forming)